ncbi:MAG: hypothetical protein HY225_03770 [Candidatus Vogelbacteria bacterium]|nr:hypothetical protein [Candidatus Vogelbacteria bacterium]
MEGVSSHSCGGLFAFITIKNMKEFIKEDWFKFVVIGCFVVLIYSIYQYLVVIPSLKIDEEKQQQDTIRNIQQFNRGNLSDCLDRANREYGSSGYGWCHKIGYDDNNLTACVLPPNVEKVLSDERQNEKDNCFKQYPQK